MRDVELGLLGVVDVFETEEHWPVQSHLLYLQKPLRNCILKKLLNVTLVPLEFTECSR